jgi:hypothetical protein
VGEARRRKFNDPDYGMPKAYMSCLELPYSTALVTQAELKRMIMVLRDWTDNNPMYCTVLHDHTQRWRKIEKLCRFLDLERVVERDPKLYGTQTVFVSRVMTPVWEDKIAAYYSAINRNGYSSPPAPPNRKTVTRVLGDSNRKCLQYMKASDIKAIHTSENSVAFQIPSDCDDLVGSFYVDFFVRQRLSDKA